jgi:hypothetical protein
MKTFTQGITAIRSMIVAGTNIGANNCKLRTREAFSVASNGTPTAAASWHAARDKHAGGHPEDAPAYSFGWATGGGSGAGHVWINLDGGRILTPGGPDDADHWYETTAIALLRGWTNLRYAGWTRSIDGQYPAQPKETTPVPPKPAPKKPKTSPGRWASFLHLANYAANDSLRGLTKASRRKDKAIDLNWHLTRDGVWVNTHWSAPLQHGFRWDKTATLGMRRLPKSTPIHKMTWSQVRHLVSTLGGYRINRVETIAVRAVKLGVRIEFEDKGGGGRRAHAYRQLAAIPAVKHLQAHGRFQVKTLVQIPGAVRRLRAAKTADFTTIVSTTNAKSKRLSLAKYGPVADYVRGSVTWTA